MVTGSGLAIGTGVAIDRLVLPELRTEPSAASAAARPTAPRASDVAGDRRSGTSGGARGAPANGATPVGPVTTPPLKELRVPARTDAPSPKTTRSKKASPPSGDAPPPGSAGPETAVALLTNTERAKAGCPALRIDQRLVTAARRHSADMAANGYFDHTSRNGDSPWKRMEDAGYPSPGAENIAKGYSTAAAVVAGWMKSPGHRANILNCKLRAIGVGRAGGSGGPLWTQDFGWK